MHSKRVIDNKKDNEKSVDHVARVIRRRRKRRIWNPSKRKFYGACKGVVVKKRKNRRRKRRVSLRKVEEDISTPQQHPWLRSSISVNSLSSVVYLGTFKKVPQLIILDENDGEQDKDTRASLELEVLGGSDTFFNSRD